MAEKKKPEYDYAKLSAKQMAEFITTYHDDEESKKAFKNAAYVETVEKIAVDVYGKDGKVKLYVDKNGKTKIKKKMIDKPNGEKTTKFNLLKAKKYFYEKYKDEISFSNLPKTATNDKKNVADDLFANW